MNPLSLMLKPRCDLCGEPAVILDPDLCLAHAVETFRPQPRRPVRRRRYPPPVKALT